MVSFEIIIYHISYRLIILISSVCGIQVDLSLILSRVVLMLYLLTLTKYLTAAFRKLF